LYEDPLKKAFKVTFIILICVAGIALLAWYAATHDVAVMNPTGMIGVRERDLIVTASALMLIVVIPVFILTWAFAWKYREGNDKAKHSPDWGHSYIAEYCWWGVPFIIIVILAVITWRSSHELNPFKPIENGKRPLQIQAVALEWKWLFIYPEYGIATVNYLEFPEKTPLNFEITAEAPMNSLWIPKLGGQIYAMPGMRTQLHLIANEVGEYRGSSANLSGTGFAGMAFKARSSTERDFTQWVDKVRAGGIPFGKSEYQELVVPSENVRPEYYRLEQGDLFERIIRKYHVPEEM
jgi:cytochrome o ubiquinol oxidase subunit II